MIASPWALIETIQHMRLEPGDTLVIRVSNYSEVETIGRWLAGILQQDPDFCGVGLIFLPDYVSIDHVRMADLEKWGLIFRRPEPQTPQAEDEKDATDTGDSGHAGNVRDFSGWSC